MTWLLGITWLPIPFGMYFALRLTRTPRSRPSTGRVLGASGAGVVLAWVGLYVLPPLARVPFPRVLLVMWAGMAAAAAVQWLGWPDLARVLLVYGLAARIPVVVVMLLAMRGGWGTHYDYVGIGAALAMHLWPRFLWLALFPQLVFWVGFTVVLGSLAGGLALVLDSAVRHARRGPQFRGTPSDEPVVLKNT